MKYSKTQKIAKMGKYPFTFKTLWMKLPKDLIKRLTSKDLAIIIDIMYQQKEYGHTEAFKEFYQP